MQSIIQTNLFLFFKVLIAFFAPIQGIILIVALSTVIDTGFGLWRASRKKHKIKSKTLRHGFVPKVMSYIGAIMFVYASEYFIVNDLISGFLSATFVGTKLVALFLIAVEIKSCDESFEDVKGWSFISKFFEMIIKLKNIKKTIKNAVD